MTAGENDIVQLDGERRAGGDAEPYTNMRQK